jgi:hypothetical protein
MLKNYKGGEMPKRIIKVLTVDQKTEPSFLTNLFYGSSEKEYDLILFLPKEEKDYLEIFLLKKNTISPVTCEELFNIVIKRDEEGYFSNFDIPQMKEEMFYQILNQEFELKVSFLSKISEKI